MSTQDQEPVTEARQALTEADKEALRKTTLAEVPVEWHDYFFQKLEQSRLGAFTNQIWVVLRSQEKEQPDGKKVWVNKPTFTIGIEGMRAIAARTKQYAGRDDYVWFTKEKETVEKHWLFDENPFACSVTGYRYDRKLNNGDLRPFTQFVKWTECVQTVNTPQGPKPNRFWRLRGHNQLAKCAEAAMLRELFPDSVGDFYIPEEMPSDKEEDIHEAEDYLRRQSDSQRAADTLMSQGAQTVGQQPSPPVDVQAATEKPKDAPKPPPDPKWYMKFKFQTLPSKLKGKTMEELPPEAVEQLLAITLPSLVDREAKGQPLTQEMVDLKAALEALLANPEGEPFRKAKATVPSAPQADDIPFN